MKICRVKGTVVASAKHPALAGHTVLVVQPLDENGADKGPSYLAVDHAQAGVGDVVLVNDEGGGNRMVLKQGEQAPIRSLIVGIVDNVDVVPRERS